MKMEAGFGIERMHGMRDAENNHRDCGIAGLRENLGRDVVVGDPVWGPSPNNWIFSTASIPIA